jgi:hypothetical protein
VHVHSSYSVAINLLLESMSVQSCSVIPLGFKGHSSQYQQSIASDVLPPLKPSAEIGQGIFLMTSSMIGPEHKVWEQEQHRSTVDDLVENGQIR